MRSHISIANISPDYSLEFHSTKKNIVTSFFLFCVMNYSSATENIRSHTIKIKFIDFLIKFTAEWHRFGNFQVKSFDIEDLCDDPIFNNSELLFSNRFCNKLHYLGISEAFQVLSSEKFQRLDYKNFCAF